MVRILAREGDDINAKTQHKMNSPLHLAAVNGHILIVKYLLELDAKPDSVNSKTETPLDMANAAFCKVKEIETAKLGHGKKLGIAPKGSLRDRLEVTVKTLE